MSQVAGNYAADLLPNMLGKKKGFPIGLYLVRCCVLWIYDVGGCCCAALPLS